MKRREFIEQSLAGSAFVGRGSYSQGISPGAGAAVDVFVEKVLPGRPHAGKVLAAIQPHADDIPLFAAGTVAKLINEGYAGYLIRTTNDEKAGRGTPGETVLNNENDNDAVCAALGLKKSFNLGYRNHRMDDISRQEMRARLIFLIRLLKIDTVISYDPWGHYEENPDHYVTAELVEAACWMAGMSKDYPEHLEAGLEPHSVRERYYFARGPQLVNRVVDITGTIDKKVEANLVNKTQGPAGNHGAELRAKLAAEGKKLAILGDDADTANRQYIKHFVLDYASEALRGVPSDRETGKKYGVDWAEAFHYRGPRPGIPSVDDYVAKHAVKL